MTDNPQEDRYEIRADDELAGFVRYRREPGEITLVHTEIDPAFEGQGLGSRLATDVLDAARENGDRVVPVCPFIRGFIRRHPEYSDLT